MDEKYEWLKDKNTQGTPVVHYIIIAFILSLLSFSINMHTTFNVLFCLLLHRKIYQWVIVVQRQCSNLSAISWREHVNLQWDDGEVCFVFDQHPKLDIYGASSVKQQSACTLVTPLEHIILIPNSILLFLLNDVC